MGTLTKTQRRAVIKGTLRPTASKVRESVFNILRGVVEGSVFVDLYAGTGAVGMEAMAQGAKTVYFVETGHRHVSAIEKALDGCGCRPRAKVVKARAADFIRRAEERGVKAGIVFLDPPYRTDEMDVILKVISESGGGRMLAEGALVMAEHLTGKALPVNPGVLRFVKSYRYGDTSLTLYRKEP